MAIDLGLHFGVVPNLSSGHKCDTACTFRESLRVTTFATANTTENKRHHRATPKPVLRLAKETTVPEVTR